eukprot:464242-Amphidinium_carterae.1
MEKRMLDDLLSRVLLAQDPSGLTHRHLNNLCCVALPCERLAVLDLRCGLTPEKSTRTCGNTSVLQAHVLTFPVKVYWFEFTKQTFDELYNDNGFTA